MRSAARLDDQLRTAHKGLRTLPGTFLLGSTGARLWADYVEPVPGFSGRFDFIHKVNVPLLYRVTHDGNERFEPCRSEWFPSHLAVDYGDERLSVRERKFITWDDCAVSCQTWTNRTGRELALRLETYGDFFAKHETGSGSAHLSGRFDIPHFSFDISGVIMASDPALLGEIRLKPGETRSFVLAGAFGIAGQDADDELKRRADAYARCGLEPEPEQVLERHRDDYHKWFEQAPVFSSSEELLDRTWAYRWFLLRHNWADPKYGHLRHPLFYEGRSHKKSKRPFDKGGWEFSKLINLSVPLQLTDARWHHDTAGIMGPLLNMKESPNEDGMFCCLTVDTIMHSFANYSCWAAWQLYTVHRNLDAVLDLLPAMKRNVQAWIRAYGTDRDRLLIEPKHTRTGKEYQPSYWYFHGFPANPKDKSTYTHLKRVDRAVYHYLNLLGVSNLCRAAGDPEAELYERLAEGVKGDILDKMWDETTRFFYDLHYETDEKAMVKNIVGVYPAWAQMVDDRYNGLIDHLFDENGFHTKCPFPTVSADSPAYSPDGGWMGRFFDGRNGCVWNGPTWPYSNSVTLDALARESKRLRHAFDEPFGYYLREYSFLHFFQRDLRQPGLVEQYSSRTGEPLSDEQEYNHSYYIDLIVTHVAGVSPEENRLVLDPLDIGLEFFELDRLKIGGRDLRVTYRRAGGSSQRVDIEEGYRLYVDGRLVFHSAELSRAELPWPCPQT